ncbi:hypothetical protein [Treponema sp. R80B11-R83G3]
MGTGNIFTMSQNSAHFTDKNHSPSLKLPSAILSHDRNRATGQQGNRATGQQGNRATGQQGNRATGQQGNRATGQQGNRAIISTM